MANGPSEEWKRYGLAVIRSMSEVLEETPAESHSLLLETADYWLSLGLACGMARPGEAARLLALIQAHDEEETREELEKDAAELCGEVFE